MGIDVSPITTRELERRMRPGVFSVGGFLGMSEKLAEVLDRDRQTLAEMNLTYDELAGHLEKLIQSAETGCGRPMRISRNLEARITTFKGFQICPWSLDPHYAQCTAGKGVRYASVEWTARNLLTKQEMRGAGLAVHLIRDHHFFEGLESPYRVDPRDLARLFELGPFALDVAED